MRKELKIIIILSIISCFLFMYVLIGNFSSTKPLPTLPPIEEIINEPVKRPIDPLKNEENNIQLTGGNCEFDKSQLMPYHYYFLPQEKRFDIFLSTDKQIYQSGDEIFSRGIILNAFTQKPIIKEEKESMIKVEIKILNSFGKKEMEKKDVVVENSVFSVSHKLPKDQKGGEYIVEAEGFCRNFCFPKVESKFQIRSFIAPRFKKTLKFERKGYSTNDFVKATVKFERTEGGIPKNPEITVRATISGVLFLEDKNYQLNELGIFDIEFELPSAIGDVVLTVIISEGITESISKIVPILKEKDFFVNFYPEGGYIINGVVTGVYFEALDTKSYPIDIIGDLVSSDGVFVTKVDTIHEGRGYFEFKPVVGVDYRIEIQKPVQKIVEINDIRDHGVQIFLNDKKSFGSKFSFTLDSTIDTDVFLGLFRKEHLIESIAVSLNVGSPKEVTLDAKDYEGVLRATLYRVFGECSKQHVKKKNVRIVPAAERLVFVMPKNRIIYDIVKNKGIYEPGSKVELSIFSKLADSNSPVESFLSVVVTDDSTYQLIEKRERQPSLLSSVFFSNEVESLTDAEIYIENRDSNVELDLLLGCQGWRRFLYKDPTKFENANQQKIFRVLNLQNVVEKLMLKNLERGNGFPVANFHAFVEEGIEVDIDCLNCDDLGGIGFDFDEMEMVRDDNEKFENVQNPEKIYYKPPKTDNLGKRSDFDDTLFFAPVLKTDETGKQKIFFNLNDKISSFRIFVDGWSYNGVLGYSNDFVVSAIKPFFIECKLPKEVSLRDEMNIPCLIANNLDSAVDLVINVRSGEELEFTENSVDLKLGEKERKGVYFPLKVIGIDECEVEFSVKSKSDPEMKDEIVKKINVVSPAFPLIRNFGGRVSSKDRKEISFVMPENYVEGLIIFFLKATIIETLSTLTKVYSSPISTLTDAVENLIREPCGCFEQTSSTLYPMILAMKYFQTHPDGVEETTLSKTNKMIKNGLNRLKSYEVIGGGFEWFGKAPAHETLTAMGINEFVDLLEVYDDVELPSIIERTKKWLLTRKTETGFKQNEKSLDSFGYAPKHIADVYICYSLSQIGMEYTELESIIDFLYERALSGTYSDDSYFIGLLALTLFNFDEKVKSLALVNKLKEFQDESGKILQSKTSITNSKGNNLETETTSIGSLNFLNFFDEFSEEARRSVRFVLKQNNNGRFGSTQATLLALKCIIKYDEMNKYPKNNGLMKLLVNDIVVDTQKIVVGEQNPIVFADFSNWLKNGEENSIAIDMTEGSEMPFSIMISMKTEDLRELEIAESDLSFDFVVKIEDSLLNEAESTEISVNLNNLLDENTNGMIVSVISIPSGLEVQYESLQDLKKLDIVDFFEIIGNSEIVFYWMGLKAKEEKEFSFLSTAKIPGKFKAKPSRCYFYYDDDKKYFAESLEIEINYINK